MDVVVPVNRKPKRCSSSEADMAPPNKSPRTGDFQSHVSQPDAPVLSGTDGLEMRSEITEGASQSPPKRRKSYRRASLARRSLGAIPKPPQNGTLEKLMETSMKMAVKRLQNTLQTVPNAPMESFQKRVDSITRECASLAETTNGEAQKDHLTPAISCDPEVQTSMENMRKAINLLKAESNSWNVLLDRHRSKAEELRKKRVIGPVKIGSIDDTSISNSSQYQLIKAKPDYSTVLSRQQPMLQTMEMIMDTQSKMVRELLSIKEQSHLIVKETSARLATAAGFNDLPHATIMKLLGGRPLSSEAP